MTKAKKTKGFIYGAVVLGISMIVVKLIGALFKIPLLNILGETGMAYFSSAYTIFTTVYAFAITGLTTSIARIVAEKKAQGRYADIKKVVGISFTLFLAFGVISSVLLFFTSSQLAKVIGSPNSASSIAVIAPAILLCCIMASYRGYFEGLNDMVPTAVSQVVEAVVKLVAGLLFAYMPIQLATRSFQRTGTAFGIAVDSLTDAQFVAIPYASAGAMAGITLSTAAGVLYLAIYSRIKRRKATTLGEDTTDTRRIPSTYKSILKSIMKVAVPITACAVVMQLSSLIDMMTIINRLNYSFSQSPKLFTEQFADYLSKGESYSEFLFGIYAASVTLFNLIPAFTALIGKSAIPVITSSWAEGNTELLREKINSIIKTTLFLSAPAGIGMAALAPYILKLLFSKQNGAILIGELPLVILAVSSVFFSLIGPINSIFQSINEIYTPIRIIFISCIIKFILNFYLVAIPELNISGSAIATFVSYVFATVYSLYSLNKVSVKRGIRIVPLKLSINYLRDFGLPITGGILCAVTALIVNKFLIFYLSLTFSLAISIIIGGIVYIIFIILSGFFMDKVLIFDKVKKKYKKYLQKS